jgi:predicted PurR-regulated permease PerM
MSDPLNAGMLAAVAVATPLDVTSNTDAPPASQVIVEQPVLSAPIAVEKESQSQVPVIGIFVLVLIAAIYLGKPVLMPVMLGVILAIVLSPLVGRMALLRMPEPVAAAVVMASLLAAMVVIGELLIMPAREVLAELPAQVQSLFVQMLDWLRSFRLGAWVAPKSNVQLSEHAAAQGVSIGAVLLRAAQSFVVSAVSAGLVAYFLLASGDLFLVKLMRVLPRVRDKVRAVKVVRTVQQEVANYFASVAIINIGLGVATALLTWVFGLPMPWFWGLLVAILNFVPYVGPGVSACLLMLASLTYGESATTSFLLAACFVGVTFVEGQIINPVVVGNRLELNHPVVFVSLLFWGWMWGIGGLLIAVPLLIVAKKFADHTPGWEAIAEFLARR